MTADPIDALVDLVGIFDELGIAYAIGGSVASSVHGEPRASADADVLVALAASHVPPLVARLESGFYVSDVAAREAVRSHRSFNAIHLASMYKVDIFVAGPDRIDREQLARRIRVSLGECTLMVTAAENLVVRKLDWFRQGGGVSELQWRDVLGVLKIQASSLDLGYMRDLAASAGVDELLERALDEAGLAP